MARNLVKAGHAVTGFDQYADCLQEASRHGISASTSIESAVASAEVVITMLPDGQHVRDVYLGDGGVLGAAEIKFDVVLVQFVQI